MFAETGHAYHPGTFVAGSVCGQFHQYPQEYNPGLIFYYLFDIIDNNKGFPQF
jgi:hypothetical protein